MNVVWLASWYPNRTNITNGDFIERQAKAVSPFLNSLTIISAVKDESLAYNTVEIVESREGNITTYIIYYSRSQWGGVLEKLLSLKKYMNTQLTLFEKIVKEKGRPQLVHVQVAMKAGVVAKKIKQQYNIPYIVSEHWTAYDKNAIPNIFTMGMYYVQQAKSVLQHSSLLITVSKHLASTINQHLLPIPYRVVPNVVDTQLFFPIVKQASTTVKLIHISNMTYQKNMEAIISALAIWKKNGGQFLLQVFGSVSDKLQQMVESANLNSCVVFNGEVLQPVLSKAVQQADALLLYSRYETFGCVIIEANACGVPVLVSDLPVFHELVSQDFNGLFVESNNPQALAAALEKFVIQKNNFQPSEIAAKTKAQFSYEVVGRQISQLYKEVLGR